MLVCRISHEPGPEYKQPGTTVPDMDLVVRVKTLRNNSNPPASHSARRQSENIVLFHEAIGKSIRPARPRR